jgi:hypothetical protein
MREPIFSPPGGNCLVAEPHGQAAALAQTGVILAPVRDLMLLLGDVMAAVLVQLERHSGCPGLGRDPLLRHPPPGTNQPIPATRSRGLKKINYVNKLACDDCKIRSQCTGGKFRIVSRLENEAVLDRMQERLAKRPGVLDRRRQTVEHPFGAIKQWMNQGAFLMRGLEKVRAEFSLTALAYNLRRVLNIVGFAELMAAVTV